MAGMDPNQIDNLLTLIEKNLEESKARIRREIVHYLQTNMLESARTIAETGSVEIPTSYGPITITVPDLNNVTIAFA